MLKKTPKPRTNPAQVPLQTDTVQVNKTLTEKRAASEQESNHDDDQASIQREKGPQNEVTQEALELAWRKFADQLPEDGPRSLYTTLVGEKPLIEGHRIHFKLVNAIQEKDLTEIKGALMEFLRAELKNTALELHTKVEKKQEVKKEFLSDREKYERFVAKNPLLEELRQRLKLDVS